MSIAGKTKDKKLKELSVSGKKIALLEKKLSALTQKDKLLTAENKTLSGIIENIQEMYYRIDAQGNMVMMNPSGLKMLGYKLAEEVLGRHVSEFWANPEERDKYLASFKDGRVDQHEINLQRKDGSILEASISSHYYYDDQGRELGIEGVIRDISQRKNAEHEREKSRNIFRTIFENSGMASFVSEDDMTISLANHEFEMITGFSKKETEGRKKWIEFICPEDREMMIRYHRSRRIKQDSAPRQYEIRIIAKDGFIKIVGLTVALIPGTKTSIASFVDLTQRHIIEENLKNSELKYRTLFESASDAIFLMDKGVVLDCNQKALEMFRCTREEMMNPMRGEQENRFWPEFQPDGSKSKEKYLKLLTDVRDGRKVPGYWKQRRADGTVFDSEVNLSFINMGGKEYLQCIVRDISERVLAEELYRTMANTSSAIVYIAQDGVYKFINPNAAKALGYSIDELLGTFSRKFVHPDDVQTLIQNGESMLRGERSMPYEFRIIRKDGSIRCLMEAVTYINYEGRKAILGNAMDITEIKEMRSQLNDLLALETSILKTISHAVLGFQNRKIIFANAAAEVIFGWKVEELLGKDARILYRSEEDYLESGNLIYSLLEQQGNCRLEIPCRHRNGRDFVCTVNASVIDKDPQSGRIVVVYEDITDRKVAEAEKNKLEAQLIQSQKMEAVGTLAGGIAHDFNNLLMGIQGCTSILMMDLHGKPKWFDRLKSIEDLVQSGAELTRQLLGFARSGKYELKTIDINSLIEKTASLFARTKKEITIHRFFADNVPLVDVDRGQMEQMLLNMLVNSWQAMPDGGDIYLKTENAFLQEDFVRSYGVGSGRYVKISIEDTGVGMDTKTKERIFEPFFTTKEIGRGTGLGLAMVYGIVRGHNGIITVTSKLSEGTKFDIYLPASSRQELENEIKTLQAIVKGNETILLVDDEEVIIDVSKEVLKMLGYNVLIAHSGHEAITIYSGKKDEIDLVVQDMIMPGMSGVETFYALKNINPAVKVILSSGYVINQQVENIMEHGCRAFIQKPFRMEELSIKIRNVLDNP
jgi:two-component system, cell cycle sensor histidine kinase and response regulator CckA